MSTLRQLAVLLVLAGIGLGSWFWLGQSDGTAADQGGRSNTVPVLLAEVREGTVRETIEAVATTRARESVAIVPLVSGRVETIHFQSGQAVSAGDVLVSLDSVIEATAVAEAEARLEDARAQFERAQQLVQSRNISESRVDELRAAYRGARARLEAAEKQLAEKSVRAPFDGIVGLREVSPGARVDSGDVVTTLDALATLEVEFAVPERYFATVSRGTSVRAHASTFSEEIFEGVIESIDSRIDPVARSFRVRAAIPNEDLRLPAGLFMTVEIVLAERTALLVPEEAVVAEGRTTHVFRIENEVARRTAVELGHRRFGEVEVSAGLAAGDRIAITGLQRLRDGMSVRVQGGPSDAPPATS